MLWGGAGAKADVKHEDLDVLKTVESEIRNKVMARQNFVLLLFIISCIHELWNKISLLKCCRQLLMKGDCRWCAG